MKTLKMMLVAFALAILSAGMMMAQKQDMSAVAHDKAMKAMQANTTQSFNLPTDRDVVVVTGYSGIIRAVYGARSTTRVDSMTIVADLPNNDFQKVSVLGEGQIFTISSKGLYRIRDDGRQGLASNIDQYPTVGMVDTLFALSSNSVIAGRTNNPFVFQYFLTADQVAAQSGTGLRSVGVGSMSTIALNNGDIYALDSTQQYVMLLRAGSINSEIYYVVPTGNAVALATNEQRNQVYLLLASRPGQNNQTCSTEGPCPPSVISPFLPGQIVQLQQALGPQGAFVNAKVVYSGGSLNNVQFGSHTFFVSTNMAYVSIYNNRSDPFTVSGNELWAFDMTPQSSGDSGAAYVFLPAAFAPDMADAALYPRPTTNLTPTPARQ
jgi:hypothetical protein